MTERKEESHVLKKDAIMYTVKYGLLLAEQEGVP